MPRAFGPDDKENMSHACRPRAGEHIPRTRLRATREGEHDAQSLGPRARKITYNILHLRTLRWGIHSACKKTYNAPASHAPNKYEREPHDFGPRAKQNVPHVFGPCAVEQKHTTHLRAPWVVSYGCPRAFGAALGAGTIRSYLDPPAGGLQAISRVASRPARMWPGVGGRLHCITPLVSHVYTETGWTPFRRYGKTKMALDLFLEPSKDLWGTILCHLGAISGLFG